MPLRIPALLLVLAIASSAFGKEKAKPAKPARTWQTLIDYVVKNGDEDPIEGSTALTLGYGGDVYAKSMGIDDDKSKDKREHGFYVVCDKDKAGKAIPKEIVFGVIAVKEADSKKEIDGYRVRLSLDGKIMRGMHATGIVGHVVHEVLPNDSKELLSVFNAEKSLYLKEIELAQLTK